MPLHLGESCDLPILYLLGFSLYTGTSWKNHREKLNDDVQYRGCG